MKKLFFAAFAAACLATSAFATPVNINDKALSHFNQSFAGIENVTWKTTENFIKASFEKGGQPVEVFYNTDGDLMGTSTHIAVTALSPKVMATIAKRYPNYKVKECIVYTNTDNATTQYVSVENEKRTIALQISDTSNVTVLTTNAKK